MNNSLNKRFNNFGFSVAKGSEISPYELKKAGVIMKEFRFYPSDINEIRRLLPDFLISQTKHKNFRFYRLSI
ncbi:hypothetical protein PLEI_3033 [Photobacterium leiognathi lrivu.4.1]|uniref:Uncharacterized protein n=1 Tax=Photobacterium leiognathi lrivu.4.1 TaxID=1248232 RepID=V5F2C0_PHOLE|nr:hypothetical protein [Photobacterium leiognathi]GAD31375.1 hypothetical protein PLEI_3033 [Photobacterium leiognathi lrivu.4.1]